MQKKADSTGNGQENLMWRLWRALRPHRRMIFLACGSLVIAAAAQVAGPYLVKIGIDDFLLTREHAGLLNIAGLYIAAQFIVFLFSFLETTFVAVAAQGLMRDLRKACHDHLMRLGIRFYDRTPAGKLITHVTNDIEALNELVSSGLITILGDLFILIGITGVMFWMDPVLALAAISMVPILIFMTRTFQKKLRQAYLWIRHQVALLNIFIQERVGGMRIVQVFNQQGETRQRHGRLNREHHDANLAMVRLHALFNPLVDFMGIFTIAVLIGFGCARILAGQLTLGELVAFLVYAEMFFKPIRDMSEKFNILQGAGAACEKIFGLLDEPVLIQDPPSPQRTPRRPVIEFDHVRFGYDGQPVIRDLSLCVQPGEMVALVGATGAGKTTLVNLLLRLYDVQKGAIRIGGVDIREMAQKDLRSLFGIVSQDVFLFSGSVWENVTLGDPAIDRQAVRDLLGRVGAHRFQELLGEGERTILPEEARTLSAGERQLLSIARALAHGPQILILDEATAHIDSQTEARVQETIRNLRGEVTQIVIAHRLSTVEEADQIVVLDEGVLVESGDHSTLMKKRGRYWGLTQRIGTRRV